MVSRLNVLLNTGLDDVVPWLMGYSPYAYLPDIMNILKCYNSRYPAQRTRLRNLSEREYLFYNI